MLSPPFTYIFLRKKKSRFVFNELSRTSVVLFKGSLPLSPRNLRLTPKSNLSRGETGVKGRLRLRGYHDIIRNRDYNSILYKGPLRKITQGSPGYPIRHLRDTNSWWRPLKPSKGEFLGLGSKKGSRSQPLVKRLRVRKVDWTTEGWTLSVRGPVTLRRDEGDRKTEDTVPCPEHHGRSVPDRRPSPP